MAQCLSATDYLAAAIRDPPEPLLPEILDAPALPCSMLLHKKDRLEGGLRSPCRFDSGSGHPVIVLNLLCDQGHRFEGWFASGDAFRSQSQRHLVHCPQCQTSAISQLPSAPHVKRGASDAVIPAKAVVPAGESREARLHQALATLARRAENVGQHFPEEARRIHYDEVPARSIRGVASADEARDLLEEGILVLPAPLPPEGEMH
jgi:hypothetical protein